MSYQMNKNCPEEQGNREMLTLGYPDTTWARPLLLLALKPHGPQTQVWAQVSIPTCS